MAKSQKKAKRPPYVPGSLEEMSPPNRNRSVGPARLATLRSETGSLFISEPNARLDEGQTFAVTLIDPFLLEELLEQDRVLLKIGLQAEEKGRWTRQHLERAELAVERVFKEQYLPQVMKAFAAAKTTIAEFAILRTVDRLECQRIHARIVANKPKRK